MLVVLAQTPAIEGGAAGRASIGLLRGLIAHGLDVTTIAWSKGRIDERPPPDLDVEVIRMPMLPRRILRWRRIADPRGYLAQPPFSDRVRELARGADVVHLEELDSAPAARGLELPKVLHLHNAWRRDRPDVPLWSGAGRLWLEQRSAERRAPRGITRLVANSPEVASELARIARTQVSVVPLALDATAYAEPARLEAPVAGLIGTAAWPPTTNAVRRLVADVWPRVRALLPDARLLLAGRGMEAARFPGLPPAEGVEWLGEVESATDFLRSLGVLLYPLGRGSGTKIKVLEAMALGVPVVTTQDGAEGLLDHGGVRVERTDEALAQATVRLLADPAERRAEGAAARANFEAHHKPKPATAPLVDLYRSLVA